jgi:hypothetical protein
MKHNFIDGLAEVVSGLGNTFAEMVWSFSPGHADMMEEYQAARQRLDLAAQSKQSMERAWNQVGHAFWQVSDAMGEAMRYVQK